MNKNLFFNENPSKFLNINYIYKDPVFKLINTFDEIQNLLKNPQFIKFFYFNVDKIHSILYELDEIINIDNNQSYHHLYFYFYLILLVKYKSGMIDYKFSFDLIEKVNIYEQDNEDYFYNIIKAKMFLELVKNFMTFNDSKSESEIEEIIKNSEDRLKNKINLFLKNTKLAINENNKFNNNIDEMYIDILEILIENEKLSDYNYASFTLLKLDFENIDLTEIMINKLSSILNKEENYKKYEILDMNSLYDEIINFHYILLKYIIKNSIIIYQISFLYNARKNIIKIMKYKNTEILSLCKEKKEEIKERINYIIEKYLDVQYYIKKYLKIKDIDSSTNENKNENKKTSQTSKNLNISPDEQKSKNILYEQNNVNINNTPNENQNDFFSSLNNQNHVEDNSKLNSFILDKDDYYLMVFQSYSFIIPLNVKNYDIEIINENNPNDDYYKYYYKKIKSSLEDREKTYNNEKINNFKKKELYIRFIDSIIEEIKKKKFGEKINFKIKLKFNLNNNKENLNNENQNFENINCDYDIYNNDINIFKENEKYQDINIFQKKNDNNDLNIKYDNFLKFLNKISSNLKVFEFLSSMSKNTNDFISSMFGSYSEKNFKIYNIENNCSADYIKEIEKKYIICGGPNIIKIYDFSNFDEPRKIVKRIHNSIYINPIKTNNNTEILVNSNDKIEILKISSNDEISPGLTLLRDTLNCRICLSHNNSFYICNENGFFCCENCLMGKIIQADLQKISVLSYWGCVKINESIIAVSSNKILSNGIDELGFYNINNRNIIKKIKGSFILFQNNLSLIDLDNKNKLLFCACKKYIINQKNGILLLKIELNSNSVDLNLTETFYETNNFEVYCFCPIYNWSNIIFSQNNNDIAKYIFVGGFDKRKKEGVIKIYQINYDDEKFQNTEIEYIGDIKIEKKVNKFKGFRGPITCIYQCTNINTILITCFDGNLYKIQDSNFNNLSDNNKNLNESISINLSL